MATILHADISFSDLIELTWQIKMSLVSVCMFKRLLETCLTVV